MNETQHIHIHTTSSVWGYMYKTLFNQIRGKIYLATHNFTKAQIMLTSPVTRALSTREVARALEYKVSLIYEYCKD